MRRIVQEADILLVTTPQAERAMVELGAARDRCLLFPGGIEIPPTRDADDLEAFRQNHAIPSNAKVVAFLGTVEERKNVLAILEVAGRLEDRSAVQFVVAGKLTGDYSRKVLSRAKRLPNVSVVGELSEGDKASLLWVSYLNITMSKLEALGLAQLEFMSAGVPVVTSGVGGQSWIVRNGETGVVLDGPSDIDGAKAAVTELVHHQSYRDELGHNAERCAARFTMKSLVKNLVKELQGKRFVYEENSPVKS